MNASVPVETDTEYKNLCSVYVEIENPYRIVDKTHKNSVVKYTRLPDCSYDSKLSWPTRNYTLQPRLRRIIAIEEPQLKTTRSLNSAVAFVPKMSATNFSRRKIVTIDENEESSLHPNFSQQTRSSRSKLTNRAVETDFIEQRQLSQRSTSRLPKSAKVFPDSRQIKPTTKSNSLLKKESSISSIKNKQSKPESDHICKAREGKKNVNVSKISLAKRNVNEIDKNVNIKIIDEMKNNLSSKYKKRPIKSLLEQKMHKELNENTNPVTVIHVPLDSKNQDFSHQSSVESLEIKANKTENRSTDVENLIYFADMNVGTEAITKDYLNKHSQVKLSHEIENNKKTFDNLEIPNVTLVKHKFEEYKENIVTFCSKSLPNLKVPAFSIPPTENRVNETCFRNSSSYIISRATLTYTTKQKINFHVVENQFNVNVKPSPVSYPVNVLSVYKKDLKNKRYKNKNYERGEACDEPKAGHLLLDNHISCLQVPGKDKLIKPSDIIGAINVNYNLIPNDIINEQFQRELHFIDSFFESLQYLENCSLTEKTFTQSNVDDLVSNVYDLKRVEYNSFFSKPDNNVDDRETMASKSLCLLNLLIRDEQRRAKNLLFVLKMREDALKDFTKSHILWLENRKKQDNIDIPTLKKKQRGALLKLQYECGEMQRMRKALLTLSEKRKVALMKTKRNIEFKLKTVDVEQIVLDKKKLKRSISTERNIPLKCFELSSSGCEESTTSRPKSITPACLSKIAIKSAASAEKCVQTADSILSSKCVDQSTSTDENCVVVDGGYLNILFRNLSLPEIFSSGKQYEVNEEALKNIVTTTNKEPVIKEGDVIKKFMDQILSHDLERSSSPSTARSLVEELDHYYKVHAEDVKSHTQLPVNSGEVKPGLGDIEPVDSEEIKISTERDEHDLDSSKSSVKCSDYSCLHESPKSCVENQLVNDKEEIIGNVAGPLPVPAGAADISDPSPQQLWLHQMSTPSSSPGESSSACSQIPYTTNICSYTSPTVQSEAEELRRQQLEVEREIKALEQQQCQLLVVREIPDKPPPPYTPPVETRQPKQSRKYQLDAHTETKIQRYVDNPENNTFDESDSFELFVKDYCLECVESRQNEKGATYWDSSHVLPQRLQLDDNKFPKKTASELSDVLKGVAPTVVSGVGARRSDHIDDILFAEWRRCEPEWTSLHKDEVTVKNQLFESIFQKILTNTIDEYKKTVVISQRPNMHK